MRARSKNTLMSGLLAVLLIACGEANDEDDVIIVEPPGEPGAAESPLAWRPAIGGTLAGATPSADGSCPDETTLIAAMTVPGGHGEMDVCGLAARYDAGGQVVTLTNDNVYRADPAGTIVGGGDRSEVSVVVEAGTLIIAPSEAFVLMPGSEVLADDTESDHTVVVSPECLNDVVRCHRRPVD
jgi:hypothetical protein